MIVYTKFKAPHKLLQPNMLNSYNHKKQRDANFLKNLHLVVFYDYSCLAYWVVKVYEVL